VVTGAGIGQAAAVALARKCAKVAVAEFGSGVAEAKPAFALQLGGTGPVMSAAIEPLRSEFLMTLEIEASPPYEIGVTPMGRRRIVYAIGGRFEGPRLSGTVVPGGGDMALIRPDGVFEINVRLLLCCNDGAMVSLTYLGLWQGQPGVLDRVLAREPGVSPGDHALRTAATFETAASDYLWLNKVLAIGRGVPRPAGGTIYQFHTIL
jgi:hypothetical protein